MGKLVIMEKYLEEPHEVKEKDGKENDDSGYAILAKWKRPTAMTQTIKERMAFIGVSYRRNYVCLHVPRLPADGYALLLQFIKRSIGELDITAAYLVLFNSVRRYLKC
jgi:hypothetical protein